MKKTLRRYFLYTTTLSLAQGSSSTRSLAQCCSFLVEYMEQDFPRSPCGSRNCESLCAAGFTMTLAVKGEMHDSRGAAAWSEGGRWEVGGVAAAWSEVGEGGGGGGGSKQWSGLRWERGAAV